MEEYLVGIYNVIKNLFINEKTGHDINHLIRVIENARKIQKGEGGNRKVILISALLHDIHRIMSNELGHFVSPVESIPLVKDILKKSNIDLNKEEMDQILDIIAKHDEKNSSDNDSLELKIIKDADTLDAMGNIGLERTKTFCRVHNIPLYNPNISLDSEDYVSDINPISCTHYVYRTMLPNAKKLRTETARKLSKNCNKVLEDFIKEQVSMINNENLRS